MRLYDGDAYACLARKTAMMPPTLMSADVQVRRRKVA